MLLDLGAGHCQACKKMVPILADLRERLKGKVEVRFTDIEEEPKAADRWGIEVIPTQIFLDAQGKELWRHVGVLPVADAMAKMQSFGWVQ
jgi:thioredoxin 1